MRKICKIKNGKKHETKTEKNRKKNRKYIKNEIYCSHVGMHSGSVGEENAFEAKYAKHENMSNTRGWGGGGNKKKQKKKMNKRKKK